MTETLGLGLAFVTGLLTSLHCVGMCGGFVVSYAARCGRSGTFASSARHAAYAAGKLVSYGVIGALFGWLGGSIAVTTGVRVAIAVVAGLLLVVYGLSSAQLLSIPRRLTPRPPERVREAIAAVHRKCRHPLLLGLASGAMVVCGPLHAMYVMAAGTGSALHGAALMVAFGAGTLPLLLGFGFLTTLVSVRFTRNALRVSGIIVLLLGALMINRGVAIAKGVDCHTGCGVEMQVH